MRNFLLLLVLFVFVSCSGAVERVVQVGDENSGESGEKADSENQEKPDEDAAPTDENGGHDENQDAENPVSGDDSQEISDADNAGNNDSENVQDDVNEPENDSDTTVPDEENPENDSETDVPDEDTEPENPDDVWSVCGVEFSGANCTASSCETVDDCCGADICVATDGCGGHKVCRTAFFKENFDSYVSGSFPNANWTLKYRGAGSQYQVVASDRYFSAENSMRMLGSKSGNLSAIMTAALPQVPDIINVEFMMNAQGDDVSLALCSFEREAPGQNWGDMYLKIEFANGKIRYQIPEWHDYEVAPSYEPNQWYKLRIKMNQPAKTVSVWVNEELKVENQAFTLDSWSIPNICLASNKNDKKVWFDDIFVWGE